MFFVLSDCEEEYAMDRVVPTGRILGNESTLASVNWDCYVYNNDIRMLNIGNALVV